ncbi:MAG: DUF6912 family protein [Ornithinimicrobium sp.]|uniref:DUF6912 family protein n=1 Tax=Ornithinimicrobium sp. TaxID=1977084 RepID=UPI001814433A|nr:hypothetical protein [Actinomycetota bacterium]
MVELVRVYVPLRPHQVRELVDEGRLAAPLFGVSTAGAPEHDTDLQEEAALQHAARLALATEEPVIIAAADVSAEVATGTAGRAAGVEPRASEVLEVTVPGDIALARVAALLVGDDVLGTQPAVVDRGKVELSWYDTTELTQLVSLL